MNFNYYIIDVYLKLYNFFEKIKPWSKTFLGLLSENNWYLSVSVSQLSVCCKLSLGMSMIGM